MSMRDLFDRLAGSYAPPRSREVDDAIKAGNEARDALRHAARLIAEFDPKLSRQMHRAADEVSAGVKRLWSL